MMEKYWAVSSHISSILGIGATAFCFSHFIKPFLRKKRAAECVGIIYFTVMLILYGIPYEMESVFAYGVGALAVFSGMYAIEHRNPEQKVFLAITAYILKWIAGGIAIIPRNILMDFFLNSGKVAARPRLQLGIYVVIELLYILLRVCIMLVFADLINRKYTSKKENMTRSEFVLMLSPLLSVMTGYWFFSFFEHAYEHDLQMYIWNAYTEYEWFLALYQVTSYGAILTTIIIFQKIKGAQREEKEKAILEGQAAELKRHISEVEKLYGNIRSLKHDIGNHMMTLDHLCQKNKYEEAQEYAAYLKMQIQETICEIKSGNPVTDVILTEKKAEAEEKGISFACDFFYPEKTKVNAFDVSIILNNAINNAIEAAECCKKPYIKITSYCKKNVYMIDIENASEKMVILDEESGLPQTTKKDTQLHGFGIANIQKVAQKYMGDIDIEQGEGNFKLSIMLIIR